MNKDAGMSTQPTQRLYFLDQVRGLVISLVILQHATQAYGTVWGRIWFFESPDRDNWFDGLFMWTDSFIMQALFFIAGMFVLPSLYRRGWLNFTWEKLTRIALPMLLGILILVPPLKYPKYELTQEPGIGYLEYWLEIYLAPGQIQAAGFWFLAMLLLFTFIVAVIDKILPFISTLFGKLASWMAEKPIAGYVTLSLILAVIIGLSDLKWGTYYWIGLDDLFDFSRDSWVSMVLRWFVARGNMVYTYVFLFFLGVGVSKAGILKESDIMERASQSWVIWVILTAVLSVTYAWYNQAYLHEGAFSPEIRYHFYRGGTWDTVWPIIADVAPPTLIRTTLHGFLCVAQICTAMTLMYRFANSSTGAWASLGACSYGIYVLHEPFVVWTQYLMYDADVANTFKMTLAFSVSLSCSWLLTAFVLRKAPGLRRIF